MHSLPDMENGGIRLGESMTGTVRWFKKEKGYGRITGDDDYYYFVPFSSIEGEGFKSVGGRSASDLRVARRPSGSRS